MKLPKAPFSLTNCEFILLLSVGYQQNCSVTFTLSTYDYLAMRWDNSMLHRDHGVFLFYSHFTENNYFCDFGGF